MKLIVITFPIFFEGEGTILNRLFQEGMERLHLRKPEGNSDQIYSLLEKIPTEYHSRIVLHDHFELAAGINIGGIHLNRRNNLKPDWFCGSISRSCHSLQEIQEIQKYNYVFLSPVFQSISKIGYGNGFALEELQEASTTGIINSKVIALGGIGKTNLPLLKHLSFGGVAILGALWGNNPAPNNSNMIIKQYKELELCL